MAFCILRLTGVIFSVVYSLLEVKKFQTAFQTEINSHWSFVNIVVALIGLAVVMMPKSQNWC